MFSISTLNRDVRMSLKESSLRSRLFHNACTWESLSKPVLATLRHAYITPLRVIACMENRSDTARFTNDQVLVEMSRPNVYDKLRIYRLTYLPRFLSNATPHLFRLALAQHDYQDAWANLIVDDLLWMWSSHDSLYTSMVKPSSDPNVLRTWFDLITGGPQTWKTMVGKFKTRFTSPAQAVHVEPIPDGINDDYVCDVQQCGIRFDSYASLRTQQAATHHMYNPIRYRVSTSRCVSCRKDFHIVSRAFRHIAYRSPMCRAYYSMLEPALGKEQVVDLMSKERAIKRAHGDKYIAPLAVGV